MQAHAQLHILTPPSSIVLLPTLSENLECNLGRMPTIAVANQGQVGQSMAQYFYVASTCGLLGSSPFEAAKCIELTEHLKELKTEWYKIVPYGR